MKYCCVLRDGKRSYEVASYIRNRIIHEYCDKDPDVVVAIGGDGTILKAAHTYPRCVILGVHTGHLGFYASYGDNQLDVLVDDINQINYKIEYLDSIGFEIEDRFGNITRDFALNEVTIVSPTRTLKLDVTMGKQYFETFRGTGFCISTPYGSTAYNKSLHGAVVDPSISCMQLTEIAGINSNSYRTLSSPYIMPANKELRFDADEKVNTDVFVTNDHLSYTIDHFKNIKVAYKKFTIRMGYHDKEDFINRLNRTFLIPNEESR